MTPEIRARLAAFEIRLEARLASSDFATAAPAREYCIFTRGECVAMVQVSGGGFEGIGSTGLMTEYGLSYLVWSEGKAILSAHGSQVEATAEQVEHIRKFSEDLKSALDLGKKIEPQTNADEHG